MNDLVSDLTHVFCNFRMAFVAWCGGIERCLHFFFVDLEATRQLMWKKFGCDL